MAIGDVVSDITSVSGGANLDFQPASGVEVVIVSYGSSQSVGTAPDLIPDIVVGLFDGTNAGTFSVDSGTTIFGGIKIFLNNTNYLRIANASASSANIIFTGITTNV